MSDQTLVNIDGDFSLRPPAVQHGTRVRSLPFKRSFLVSLFMGAFFCAFCTTYFMSEEFMGGPEGNLFSLVTSLFLFFFMLAWSAGVSLLGMMFLGTLFGGETTYLSPGKLVIRK